MLPLRLLPILCALPLLAADWKDKPFPDWSEDTVIRVVTDSPWAKAKSVRFRWTKEERPITYKDIPGNDRNANQAAVANYPLGAIGVPRSVLPDHDDIILRWASALPVRQAKALYKLRDEKLDDSKLNALIAAPEDDYVLEIYGLPAEVAHKGPGMVEIAAKDSVYLRTRNGKTVRPNRVEVKVNALSLTILVHFPRTAALAVGDQEVECFGNLQIFEFREKFRLGAMMYLNHLEM